MTRFENIRSFQDLQEEIEHEDFPVVFGGKPKTELLAILPGVEAFANDIHKARVSRLVADEVLLPCEQYRRTTANAIRDIPETEGLQSVVKQLVEATITIFHGATSFEGDQRSIGELLKKQDVWQWPVKDTTGKEKNKNYKTHDDLLPPVEHIHRQVLQFCGQAPVAEGAGLPDDEDIMTSMRSLPRVEDLRFSVIPVINEVLQTAGKPTFPLRRFPPIIEEEEALRRLVDRPEE